MSDVEIICVGGAKFDLLALLKDLPTPDERILVPRLYPAIGGQAITAAVAIARLGVPVAYCGVIGRDAAGDHIMERLEEEGISARWVQRRSDMSTTRSMNIITTSNATRVIITERSVMPDSEVLASLKAPWIHFDDIGFPNSGLLRRGRRCGMRFSIDGGNAISGLDLQGIDLYAPTMSRLQADYGSDLSPRAAMQAAIDRGARAVVATVGAKGAYYLSNESFALIPGFKVEVVSTLGAGDVFHGAILAALCLGKELPDALRWGNACAALSCRAIDGQTMAPHRAELEQFLADIDAGKATSV